MKITLEIYKNRIVLKDEIRSVTSDAKKPFSTLRLLVGDFEAADACLRAAASELGIVGIFKRKPSVLVRLKELVEGGISPVEDRIFRELALCLGAKDVAVIE